MYTVTSTANKDSIPSFFLIFVSFISVLDLLHWRGPLLNCRIEVIKVNILVLTVEGKHLIFYH